MGRLITVSLILILGAWGGAVEGAVPDDAAAAPSSATRQPPPAPPIKYLEAGARLFNSAADGAQLELASKYLQAADTYRDQLQPDEQATLDAYLKELAKAKAVVAWRAAAPAATPSAPAAAQPPGGASGSRCRPAATASGPAAANQSLPTYRYEATGPVAASRSARAASPGQLRPGPAKGRRGRGAGHQVGAFRRHARQGDRGNQEGTAQGGVAARSQRGNQPHDRHTAKAKLHEARSALANRQFEQAEAIALDVKNWGLTYGFFEDNPDKVAAAARALRAATRSATRRPVSSRARECTTSWCRSRGS